MEPPVKSATPRIRKRLGEMLIDAGLLTEAQLEQALSEQKRRKIKLGQLLIQDNILKERQILRAVSRQLRIELYEPDSFPPDPSLAVYISEKLAHQHNMIPLKKDGQLLWVAMQDPTDFHGVTAVMSATNLDVEPVMCTGEQFLSLFQGTYGKRYDPNADFVMDIDDIDVESESIDEAGGDTFTIDSLQSMAEEAPVVRLVNSILVQALNRRASDIHIQPEQDAVSLRMRVDGRLEEVPGPPKAVYLPLCSRIKLLSNMDISVSRVPQDGRFTYRAQDKEISVRTSTVPSIYGEKLVLRLLDQSSDALRLEELGMQPHERKKVEEALERSHGMILATGPTGSGKTTLLYSLLRKINKPSESIVTLEDPVEYRLKGVCQIQLNLKAGMTFASGLRSVLRQDPDTIMIGEIRDIETADIAIKSALTGHRVLSTLHTNDAPGAVTRFVEMGVEPFLVASTVVMVSAQRLVRRICPDCIEPYNAPLDAQKLMGLKPDKGIRFFRGRGCYNCGKSGYRGRVGVYEILVMDNTVRELIMRRATAQEIREEAIAAKSFTTLRMDAARKALEGLITFEEFATVGYEP